MDVFIYLCMYGWTYGRKYIYIYILLYERLFLLKDIGMSVYVYLLIFFLSIKMQQSKKKGINNRKLNN